MLSRHFKLALAVLGLAAAANAATSRGLRRRGGDGEPYCPSVGDITHDERDEIFNAFNKALFDAANNDRPDEIAAVFATYVSPDLIEHTAASSSYASDVGFLTALLPGTTLSPVGGLSGCFKSAAGQNICTIHYAAFPDNEASLLPNVTAISDFYRYDGSCIVEHWDSTYVAGPTTSNPNFPGSA